MKINTVMCVFSKLRICRSLKIIWLFCLPLSLLLHVFSASDGAAVHGPEGPRQRAVDCGAGSGGQERSQHQVRDHYFLTYTRHVHSCVCVPFRGCPVLGPRPGVGHERRTPPRHLTGWKTKTKHPAPPPLAEPVHCMMTFGAALSRSSFSLSPLLSFVFALPSLARAPSSCLQGWRMTFEPRAMVHFSVSTCRGNRPFFHFLFVGQSAVNRLVVLLPVSCCCFFFFLLMVATVWLRLSPPFFSWLPPSLFSISLDFSPFVKQTCCQNTAKCCDSVLAVRWAQSGSWQWGMLSKHDNWRKVQTF